MIETILLLGGNVGDVEATFAGVVADLERGVGHLKSLSSVVRSKAWGFESDDFANQAVVLATELKPLELLDALQELERSWGRCREQELACKLKDGVRYMARTIDIDIIFYGDQLIDDERLTIPHALVGEREFALEPIAQIAPHWRHAASGKSVEQMLNELSSR